MDLYFQKVSRYQWRYFWVIALLSYCFLGCEKLEEIGFISGFQEIRFSEIKATSAIVETDIEGFGDSEADIDGFPEHGHCWKIVTQDSSLTILPSLSDPCTQLGPLTQEGFTSILTDLQSGQLYAIRAYVINQSDTTIYSETAFFRTKEITITTENILNKAFRTATIVGRVIGPDPNDPVEAYGHCYAINKEPTIADDTTNFGGISADNDVIYQSVLSSLENGVPYQCRAYAIKNGTIFYGNTVHFLIDDVWEPKQNLPFTGEGRWWMTGFAIGDKGYAGVGWDGRNLRQEFYEYDSQQDSWTRMQDFPGEGRQYAIGFSLNGKGYLGFGFGDNGYKGDLWSYDPQTNTWEEIQNVPISPRKGPAVFIIDNQAYIGLGQTSTFSFRDDFYRFDPLATQPWDTLQRFLGEPRSDAIAFAIDGKGYIGTGTSRNIAAHQDFWSYDPNSEQKWFRQTNVGGGGRFLANGFQVLGIGYVAVGADAGLNAGSQDELLSTRSDIWAFDPMGQGWSQRASLSNSSGSDEFSLITRVGAFHFVIGNRAYIGAGLTQTIDPNDPVKGFNDFYMYIPKTTP